MEQYYDITFKHPFTLICAGPSQTGKTIFIRRLLEHGKAIFSPLPGKVIWITGSTLSPADQELLDQKLIDKFIVRELPPEDEIYAEAENCSTGVLVIFDDFMGIVEKHSLLRDLFTKGRHRNISTIFVTQNLFSKGPNFRTISINASYIAIFRSIRDKSSIFHFARQYLPRNVEFIMNAYENAVQTPYGYLLFDLKIESHDSIRIRSNLFNENGDSAVIVYQEVPSVKNGIY